MKNIDPKLINKFYSRQIKIPEIDVNGQEKINKSGLFQFEEDIVSNFVVFLCVSIGFGTLLSRSFKNYYNDLKLRNPILGIKKVEEVNLKEFEKIYVFGKTKIDSLDTPNIFHINLRKEGKKIEIEFSKKFKHWIHDIKNSVDGRMLACILTAEIVKHILEGEKEMRVELELPKELVL